MKKSVIAAAMAASLAAATAVRAETHSIELSLWSPTLQIGDTSDDISGLRLALYGENHNMTGVDIGLWTVTTGEFFGLQLAWIYSRTEGDFNGLLDGGIVSRVRGEMYGVDLGFITFVDSKACGVVSGLFSLIDGEMKGFQFGFVNYASTLNGFQLGFVNTASALSGFQLGLVNWAERGYGLQIGLINVFGDGFLPVFPIVNFNF